MNRISKNAIIGIIAMLVISAMNLSMLNSKVSAGSEEVYFTDADVEELAEVLELLFDQSTITEDGVIVNYNEDLLHNKLGLEYPGIARFVENSNPGDITTMYIPYEPIGKKQNPKWTAESNKCVLNKLNDSYGPAAATAILDAIMNKNWTKGAKKLLQLGIKGTIPGIAANLLWIAASCGDQASKKYPRYIPK